MSVHVLLNLLNEVMKIKYEASQAFDCLFAPKYNYLKIA